MSAQSHYQGPYHEEDPEQDSIRYSKENECLGRSSPQTGNGDSADAPKFIGDYQEAPFVPPAVVDEYFSEPRRVRNLLKALFPNHDFLVRSETLHQNHARALCILIRIEHGKLIKYFHEYTELYDDKSPFSSERPARFPITSPDCFPHFRREQLCFYPVCFKEDFNDSVEAGRILPITDVTAIKDGGTARTHKVVIHPDFDRLTKNHHSSNHVYVIKTYTGQGAQMYYKKEKDAFRRIISNGGNDPALIGFFGNFSYSGSYNILLEYANMGTSEDYFNKIPSPRNGQAVISFWTNLLTSTCRALGRIAKGGESEPGEGIPSFYGWHQDIKPANILVCKRREHLSPYEWEFKLADSGLSHFKRMMQSGQPVSDWDTYGTKIYGAPECSRHNDYDASINMEVRQSVDVWSSGCVFSEAATWMAGSKESIQAFYDSRREDTGRIQGFRDGACFHDGHKVLKCVLEHHKTLRGSLIQNDFLTDKVSDIMVAEMLGHWYSRPNVRQLSVKSERIIKQAKEELETYDKKSPRSRNETLNITPRTRPPSGYRPADTGFGLSTSPESMEQYEEASVQTPEGYDNGHTENGMPELLRNLSSRASEPEDLTNHLRVGSASPQGHANSSTTTQRFSPNREPRERSVTWDDPRAQTSGHSSPPRVQHMRNFTLDSPPVARNPSAPRPGPVHSNKPPMAMRPAPGIVSKFQPSRATSVNVASSSRNWRNDRPSRAEQQSREPNRPLTIHGIAPIHHIRGPATSGNAQSQLDRENDSYLEAAKEPPDEVEIVEVQENITAQRHAQEPAMSQRASIPKPEAAHSQREDRPIRQAPPNSSIAAVQDWIRRNQKAFGGWRSLWRQSHASTGEQALFSQSSGRDHVFIVDDSETMADHWAEVKVTFKALAYSVKHSDDDGIDLFFTVSGDKYTNKHTTPLVNQLERRTPKGRCNVDQRLAAILRPYQARLQEALEGMRGTTTNRNTPPLKKLSVYVLTDAVWEGGARPHDTIRNMAEILRRCHYTRGQVGIQFIQFGADPECTRRLEELDSLVPGDRDIVDTESRNGNVWKMLSGAINPLFDEIDEPGTAR